MYIKVKVSPDSKKEIFEQVSAEQFKVFVKEPAKMNMANRRVVKLVARHFHVLSGKVRIISGHRSRNKILDVAITSASQ